jgi:hypothetical protein
VKLFQRLPRREVLVIAGAALAAFAVTLAIMGAGVRARSQRTQAEQRAESPRAQKPPVLSPEEMTLAAEDFLLPDLGVPPKEPAYIPYRPRLQRWNEQVAGAFWVPPRTIAADIIASINDRAMQQLFEKVP